MSEHNKYWFQDPINTILYVGDIYVILPTENMSYPEKITTLVRLTIYIGLILAVLDYRFLLIPITTMLITIILYYYRVDNVNAGTNNFKNVLDDTADISTLNTCPIEPTENNPFMNMLPYDDRRRGPAASHNPEIKTKMAYEYNKGAVNDAGDIFGRNNGSRQFYTMPNTSYPNKQIEFAKWLYGTRATCKDGNGIRCAELNYNMPGFTR